MPKPKDHDPPRHEHHREQEHENIGDDPQRHDAIIARRWSGSPEPTFERYANALKQWSALPGAVMRPSGQVPEDEGNQ